MRAGLVGTLAAGVIALAFAGGLLLGTGSGTGHAPRAAIGADTACAPPAKAMARVELLLGASRADGRAIGDEEWRAFLDAEVTPRFPDGLTVLTGDGQWRNSTGRITRERSRVMLVWYIPRATSSTDVDAIREAYKKQFAQESVMRVDGAGCVSF